MAKDICKVLNSEGFQASFHDITEKKVIADSDLLVLAGGDGSLMNLLPELIDDGPVVYMLPTGNESLFAKEFQMTCDAETLLRRIRRAKFSLRHVPTVRQLNTGLASYFFTMLSIGFDSQVIKKISDNRTNTINHLSYLLPSLSTALSHHPPCLSLEVDGEKIFENKQGFLIVGNSSSYALGINFLPEANSSNSELVARFFPYKTALGFLALNIRALPQTSFLNLHNTSSELVRGSCFKISTESKSYPAQVDGEHLGTTPLEISSTTKTIKVLAAKENC